MSDSAAAAEHLKVIRGMMERATVYRAISAPAAIFGGLLALGTGAYFIWRVKTGERLVSGQEFFWIWVGVLIVVDLFNTILLWRRARDGGEPLFSPAMRHACFAIVPAMVVGGMLSYEAVKLGEFELCALAWVLCYAVALLGMGGAAPRSLRRLGWMFLVAGAVFFFTWRRYAAAIEPHFGVGEVEVAAIFMMLTFGLLHLLHGAGVLLRREADTGGDPA